jgi:hypothetical protein
MYFNYKERRAFQKGREGGPGDASYGACSAIMHIQSKLSIGNNIISFPSRGEGELGHMAQKEVLEDLVLACAFRNKFKIN